MFQSVILCVILSSVVLGYPSLFQTQKFKVGIEYELHADSFNGRLYNLFLKDANEFKKRLFRHLDRDIESISKWITGNLVRYIKTYGVGETERDSLPMNGGSDRYRHRNNYDPFFVTITATAKKNFVISYVELSATTDASGEVDFHLVRGQTGSRSIMFQLVSNNSDFLSYSYLAYGIREEEYKKMANIVTLPMPNNGSDVHSCIAILTFITIMLRFIMS